MKRGGYRFSVAVCDTGEQVGHLRYATSLNAGFGVRRQLSAVNVLNFNIEGDEDHGRRDTRGSIT